MVQWSKVNTTFCYEQARVSKVETERMIKTLEKSHGYVKETLSG